MLATRRVWCGHALRGASCGLAVRALIVRQAPIPPGHGVTRLHRPATPHRTRLWYSGEPGIRFPAPGTLSRRSTNDREVACLAFLIFYCTSFVTRIRGRTGVRLARQRHRALARLQGSFGMAPPGARGDGRTARP